MPANYCFYCGTPDPILQADGSYRCKNTISCSGTFSITGDVAPVPKVIIEPAPGSLAPSLSTESFEVRETDSAATDAVAHDESNA